MDLFILGAIIAGVVLMHDVRHMNCWVDRERVDAVLLVPEDNDSDYYYSWPLEEGHFYIKKSCLVQKVSWSFGLLNCILWFISTALALFIFRQNVRVREKSESA